MGIEIYFIKAMTHIPVDDRIHGCISDPFLLGSCAKDQELLNH